VTLNSLVDIYRRFGESYHLDLQLLRWIGGIRSPKRRDYVPNYIASHPRRAIVITAVLRICSHLACNKQFPITSAQDKPDFPVVLKVKYELNERVEWFKHLISVRGRRRWHCVATQCWISMMQSEALTHCFLQFLGSLEWVMRGPLCMSLCSEA
jgi:hypothetical protein